MLEIRFDGQTVAITGGGNGIGRGLAEGFAAAGAAVAVLDRDEDAAGRVAARIGSAGGKARAFGVDISRRRQVHATAGAVAAQLGEVCHLINNAGVHGLALLTDETSDELWDRIVETNITGTYNATRAFLPQIKNTRGTILNIVSNMAFIGSARLTAYASSKAAIHNFTQALSVELGGDGVRVNAIAPGLIATEMTDDLMADPGRLDPIMKRVSLGREGRPEDIVGPALLLCSPAAGYVTGATLRVDGGWLAR